MKIGIFGGTFNPPHKTHEQIVLRAKEQLGLNKIIVFPCGDPPHKICGISKFVRLKMAELAFGAIAEVDDYEICKQGKSYTVDTLRYVKNSYPNAQLYLIIGGDSFFDFSSWHEPYAVAQLATVAVVGRGEDITSEQTEEFKRKFNCDVELISHAPDFISSSEVRLKYQFGLSVKDIVSNVVDDFISERRLYHNYFAMTQKLRSMLTDKRYLHTFYVVKRGQELAQTELKQKAFLACLLHDCAKYVTDDSFSEYGFIPSPDMPQSVLHAFLGAIIAEKKFGIDDAEVLNAIKYHCTAHSKMTLLEKIVYVADKTEETRPYPIKHLLQGTLDDMFIACLKEASEFCSRDNGNVYYLTKQALDYYIKK